MEGGRTGTSSSSIATTWVHFPLTKIMSSRSCIPARNSSITSSRLQSIGMGRFTITAIKMCCAHSVGAPAPDCYRGRRPRLRPSTACTARPHPCPLNGATNGIVWDIDNTAYNATNPSQSGPLVLHAYDASNVATEMYNSSQAGSRDTAGMALKFTVPTIAGGRAFVPTANELDIYGLLAP